MVREGRVLIPGNSGGDADFGSGFLVTAYTVGAQVASSSSGTTIQVRAGHGFQAGYKLIVWPAAGITLTAITTYRIVESVTSTSIDVTEPLSVSQGEFLVNLGTDNGTFTPQYNGSRATVYTTMSYTTTLLNSTTATDSGGRYRYFHKGIPRWELVRTSTGAPYALYLDSDGQADEDLVSYQVRYAHLFATSGTGTAADPWVTSGSNPVQAAINDILSVDGTTRGGTVRCVAGVYDLGSTDGAVTLGSSTENMEGWTIEGYGAGTTENDSTDGGTIFTFSGVGSAFKLGDFTTANKTLAFCTIRGFKLLQTGTDGTGIGILARLFRHNVLEDILVEDFNYGAAMATVSDFNTFRRFRVRDCRNTGVYIGYTSGMNTPNGQCNANLFDECDIMNISRDSGYTNFGIYIDQDSVGNVIRSNCRFHNFDTTNTAAIICRNSNRLTVDSCYFEGNYFGVWFENNDATDEFGCTVTNNYVTQTEKTCIFLNCGSTGLIQGATVTGNHLTNPNTSSPYNAVTGIVVHNNARNVFLAGNEYVNMTTADVTIGGASATYGRLEDGALTITGAASIGGAATITGNLTLTAGTVTGDITATGNITSGGHLQGLLAAFNLSSNDVIPHGGRFMVNITNVSGTNTFTVAAPSGTDGKLLILKCEALTSGTMSLADSGNVDLSAAWTPNAGDTLTLVAEGVVWYELCRSAN